tara:strand:- start:5354 stop:5506 length:153 start_codon:yes stop_codon:yes gene_type:complete
MKASLNSQVFALYSDAKNLIDTLNQQGLENSCIGDGKSFFVFWAELKKVS